MKDKCIEKPVMVRFDYFSQISRIPQKYLADYHICEIGVICEKIQNYPLLKKLIHPYPPASSILFHLLHHLISFLAEFFGCISFFPGRFFYKRKICFG